MWGGLASQRCGSTSSFYGPDSQHCARILTSSAGAITDALSFKAFGEELATGTTVNPFGYVGLYLYYTDDDGNMAIGPRILVPVNGIWMPGDPIGWRGGAWNLYLYVENNAIRWLDPSGRAACLPCCETVCSEDVWKEYGSHHCKDGGYSKTCPPTEKCDGLKESGCDDLEALILYFARGCVKSCDPKFGGEGGDQPFLAQTCCCGNFNGTGRPCGYRCCESNIKSDFNDLHITNQAAWACGVRCIADHERGHEYECLGWKEGLPDPLLDECCPSVRGLQCILGIWRKVCSGSRSLPLDKNISVCENVGRTKGCNKKAGY